MIDIKSISVDYGSTRVLEGFDLEVDAGELVSLLGPSGSGKTTALRAIGGFLHPSQGQLIIGGKDVSSLPPEKRSIGIVFQSYALFPHMSVFENVEYALRIRGVGRSSRRKTAESLIDLVRLGGQGEKKPSRLSGGQQQRVALARALAMEPQVLLLDEPLSNLDANLRKDVGEEIRRLQLDRGLTALMVTHDRQEAFGMSDRIAVLSGGRIEQLGSPADIYRNPCSSFIAEFVGQANLIPATVRSVNSSTVDIECFCGRLPIPRGPYDYTSGSTVQMLIRPEALKPNPPDGHARLATRVAESFYYGSTSHLEIEMHGQNLQMTASGAHRIAAGDQLTVGFDPEEIALIPNCDRSGPTHAD
ncbi:ABC transporter ATP-binding protein [Brevibacterium oceani]|uniref:ABC transporter ATP-binding protein n=1 Tax=Brevibacterium oceani TaxID=358099 RepID=UPI0015E72B0A|nr:ABC transporter ATP-binding protein [Brevibacterium oceani]